MISDHPRTPVQVVVDTEAAPGLTCRFRQLSGAVFREGLGMSFLEEPIGQIDRVDLHVQYAGEPIALPVGESPAEHRKRLQAHGQVVRTTITPTERKE